MQSLTMLTPGPDSGLDLPTEMLDDYAEGEAEDRETRLAEARLAEAFQAERQAERQADRQAEHPAKRQAERQAEH